MNFGRRVHCSLFTMHGFNGFLIHRYDCLLVNMFQDSAVTMFGEAIASFAIFKE